MVPEERFAEIVDPADGVRWRVDVGFLGSGWRCRWGDGCLGILDVPAEALGQGCCSVGAELLDVDEALAVAALATTLDPARFANHAVAADGGVFRDARRDHTRLVDGACIFLNPPDFPGGAGCALHLGALADGESPVDWKPSVCWQLPLKVDRAVDDDGTEVATLRRWRRTDWGEDAELAWCCTQDRTGTDCYDGDEPVVASMTEELQALVGTEVFVELGRRIRGR